jgi:hypothetical protein
MRRMGAMGLDCGALSKEKKCHLFFSARRRSPNIDQAAVQNEICVAAVRLVRFGVVGDGALIVSNIETEVAAIVEGDGTNFGRHFITKIYCRSAANDAGCRQLVALIGAPFSFSRLRAIANVSFSFAKVAQIFASTKRRALGIQVVDRHTLLDSRGVLPWTYSKPSPRAIPAGLF